MHYKRDELKKLWLDGVEQKHILELLERIDKLKDSPERVASLLAKNEYLEATQILTQSMEHLYGDLKNVDGLSEVKEILDAKKEKLYETLIEDLTKQLYVESTWEVLRMKRSGFDDNGSGLRRSGSDRGSGKVRHSGRGSGVATNSSFYHSAFVRHFFSFG